MRQSAQVLDEAELPATVELAAQIEPFDSFWEAPEDVESGYKQFDAFYRHNYLRHIPADRQSRIGLFCA